MDIVLPSFYFIFAPFVILPKLIAILVYFSYCAKINKGFTGFKVLLNHLKMMIESLKRQQYYKKFQIHQQAHLAVEELDELEQETDDLLISASFIEQKC